jgi:ABC-type transport system involved in multi-copper enzyme maturation permease subunit
MNQDGAGWFAMRQLRMILPMMRADFLERVRSYSFLAMLLFSVFLTYFFLPSPDAYFYANLAMGAARPAYTSAAIGSLTTLLMGEFFTLFAFYLVKGSIERDRRTGVGQVIATTPISRPVYMLGKWLSNVAVIAAMVAVIILAAGILQLVRGEDPHIELWALAAPFIIILLPALVLVAALAVLFESINLLRGGLGNVFYFAVFILLLGLPVDFEGINILYPSLYQACAAQFSGCSPARQIDVSGALAGLPTFTYTGIDWT